VNATARLEPLSHYRAQFDAVKHSLPGDAAEREAAFMRFQKLGFPTQREEAWKYTNLRRLETRSFAAADRTAATTALVPTPGSMGLPQIVLVDGYRRDDLSTAAAKMTGVTLRSGADFARPADADRGMRVTTAGGTERFVALNAALSADPQLIDIEAKDASLHVVCVSSGSGLRMSHPRLRLRLADHARLRLVLEHLSDDAVESWVNSVLEIELGRGATLDLYRLQHLGARTFHTERLEAHLAADARLFLRDASLGGTLARMDLTATLDGPNAAV
jgi:Fe-S cluster assembly protein SufD